MTLRNKLSISSTLLFAFILGIVILGTFLLFKKHTNNLYFKRLQERAYTTAFFYFEKDELNLERYREIEAAFRRIHSESVSVYTYPDKHPFVKDGITGRLSDATLENIAKEKSITFFNGATQYAGIFYSDNQGDFIIVVSGTDLTGIEQLKALKRMLLLFYAIGIVIHYFLARFLSRQTFNPFSTLIKKVNTITTENLHSRLPLPSGPKDEMNELIATFNELLRRLENGVQIQKNFLKHASHELKTPLTVIIGDAEVALKQDRSVEEYEKALRSLKNDALHLKSILESLLLLSGLELSDQNNKKTVRIDEILWDVLEKKKIEYPDATVLVNLETIVDAEDLQVANANRELLFIALSNIIDNALKFSSPPFVKIFASSSNQQLLLSITDKGPGIPLQDRDTIFNAFFRSDATRHIKGKGLGLYITREILDLHHISIEVCSAAEQTGTTIRLSFPRH